MQVQQALVVSWSEVMYVCTYMYLHMYPELGTPHYKGQKLVPNGVRYRGVPLYHSAASTQVSRHLMYFFPYIRLTVLVNGPCPCHCLDHRVYMYTWQWETQTNVKFVYFNHKPVTNRHTYVCTYVRTYIHTDIQAQPQTKTPPVPAEPA